jgi:hypothetical protein
MLNKMLNTIFYTLIGIPTGYITSFLINDIYFYSYDKHISNKCKYSIITTIVFFAFVKGYTGNDLVKNITLWSSSISK